MDNQSIDPNETETAVDITFEKQEFFNWCDANDIDHATEGMDEDTRKDFQKIEKHFTAAIKDGRLTVDGEKFVYTVSDRSPNAGEKFTVKRPNGKDFIAMEGFKDSQQMQKFNAFIASMAGKEKSYVARLDIKDRQFLQDIGTLFTTA
jgi:hypothetical protein